MSAIMLISFIVAWWSQSHDTDIQRLFIQRSHRPSLPIWEENDGGYAE